METKKIIKNLGLNLTPNPNSSFYCLGIKKFCVKTDLTLLNSKKVAYWQAFTSPSLFGVIFLF